MLTIMDTYQYNQIIVTLKEYAGHLRTGACTRVCIGVNKGEHWIQEAECSEADHIVVMLTAIVSKGKTILKIMKNMMSYVTPLEVQSGFERLVTIDSVHDTVSYVYS